MIDERFVFVGLVIGLIGSISYVVDTIKGKTQPNRVTWFLWALAPFVAFSAMMDQGVGLVSVMTLSVGIGPFLIFCASFFNKQSVWKMSRFDYVCGAFSLLALVGWYITKEANAAIALSLLADALALTPTLVKSIKDPESESSLVFLMATINSAIALLVLDTWTFSESAFPLYIFIGCALMFVLIQFKIGPRIKARFAKTP